MRRVCRLFPLIVLPVIVLVVSVACGPAAKPTASPDAASTAPTSRPVALGEWEAMIKAAQKEGSVNIYGTAIAPLVAPLGEAFQQKFGIDLQFVQGRPPEVTAKLTAERRAGIFLADVGHLGETTSTMDIKPRGITVALPPLLLPEVKDPKSWLGGKLPFVDKENHVLMFGAMAVPHGVANSDIVNPGGLTSFLDLLKPEWKGKIIFSDPGVSGTSPNLLAVLYKTFGKERAMEVFRQLAAQEPMITRDQRLLLEWVARGKYPIGIGQSMTLYSEFRRAGAPLMTLNFKEPRLISGGPSNLVVFQNSPHPRATQLYVNWLLSQEGATIWSRAVEYPSRRADVTAGNTDPEKVPRNDDVFPDEEHLLLRLEIRNLSAGIFGPLVK